MIYKRLKFSVFRRKTNTETEDVLRKLRSLLKGHEIVESRVDDDTDYAISIGGDGTFINTAAKLGDRAIPILGINTGRLGYLADIRPDEIETALEEIIGGTCRVEDHTVIHIEAEGLKGYPYALNEVAVLKRDTASMISIHTEINGEPLTTYQADGLLISTPTGSTAYNLSNGGPIMATMTKTLCLTAVAPHALNTRPIVIPADSLIRLKVDSRSHTHLVAIDGRSESLKEGTEMTITKAPFSVKIIRTSNKSFFSTLREKLMWGSDVRDGRFKK